MKTIYETFIKTKPLKQTLLPKTSDVCIIGAGYAGMNTAVSLLERQYKGRVVILESAELGFGASGKNGGFVFGGYSLSPETMLRNLGEQKAKYLLTVNAVSLIRSRIEKYQINCHSSNNSGVLLVNWFNDSKLLQFHRDLMLKYFDTDWKLLSKQETQNLLKTERYYGALLESEGFHFNPLAYLYGLAERLLQQENFSLHQHTPALDISYNGQDYLVKTEQGNINAKHVVIACGGYFHSFYPSLGCAVMPVATYIIATNPLPKHILENSINTSSAVYDTRFAFDYYHTLDQRIIWGGRIEMDKKRSPETISELLKQDLIKVFPQLKPHITVNYAWSGMMAYALHKMPIIGFTTPNLWHAFGFGGHGVAPTAMAGEILADCIISNKKIPAGFDSYGPTNTFGMAGLMGVQIAYWYFQIRDILKDRIKL